MRSDATIEVKGLKPLQSSLRKAEGDKRFKKSLRELGKSVLTDARANAPVGPRPKSSKTPALAGSLKVSVTAKGVSVYSNAAHAYVQDRGGKLGKGAILPRASASGYLTKAVNSNQARVRIEVNKLLAKLERDLTKGS